MTVCWCIEFTFVPGREGVDLPSDQNASAHFPMPREMVTWKHFRFCAHQCQTQTPSPVQIWYKISSWQITTWERTTGPESRRWSIDGFFLFLFSFFSRTMQQQRQQWPQRLYRAADGFMENICLCRLVFASRTIWQPLQKTHLSVCPLHDSHAAALCDVLSVQALAQIFQALRIWNRLDGEFQQLAQSVPLLKL